MSRSAADVLSSALVFGINPSLESTERLCAAFGNPQQSYDSISVVGTNGKTSTARYTAALLQASGLTVGLYTSPELVNLAERIEVNGQIIGQAMLDEAVLNVYEKAVELDIVATQFELLTVAAFNIFAKCKVQVAVLEAGLGGRWDSTAVGHAKTVIFSSIGLDHTQILGNTIERIARDKAHILTSESTAIIGAGVSRRAKLEIMQYADEIGASVYEVEPVHLLESSVMPGEPNNFKRQQTNYAVKDIYNFEHNLTLSGPVYQLQNTAAAINAIESYLGRSLDTAVIQSALTACLIPGRFDFVQHNPPLILDSAHNPQAAHWLMQDFADFLRYQKRELKCGLLLGILADKDCEGILRELCSDDMFSSIAFVTAPSPRACSAEELSKVYQSIHSKQVEKSKVSPQQNAFLDVEAALSCLSAASDLILCTGSITLIGQVAKLLK